MLLTLGEQKPWVPQTHRRLLRCPIVLPPTPWHMTQHDGLWHLWASVSNFCELRIGIFMVKAVWEGDICHPWPPSERGTHYISLALPSLHFTSIQCFGIKRKMFPTFIFYATYKLVSQCVFVKINKGVNFQKIFLLWEMRSDILTLLDPQAPVQDPSPNPPLSPHPHMKPVLQYIWGTHMCSWVAMEYHTSTPI